MNDQNQKIVIYWNLKKTLSLICALLLVPAALFFIFTFVFKTTIISPKFYKDNLQKADVYNQLIQDGVPSLILESKISEDNFIDTFSKEMMIFVVRRAIDPAWIKTISEGVIDKIANYFAAPRGTMDKIDIDLKTANQFLVKASAGLTVLDQVLPACENCAEIRKNIEATQEKINNINLGVVNIEKEVAESNTIINFIRKFARNIKVDFWVSLAALLILILLIVLLELKNLPTMLKFISWPLIFTSFFSLLGVWLMTPLSVNGLSLLHFDLPAEMETIIIDFIRVNVLGIIHRAEIISAVIFIFFLLLVTLVFILEKRNFKFFGKRA